MGSDGKVWRVLVADDHHELRRLLALTLEFDGRLKVVASAADGTEAISMAHAARPDLAVLDQMLGGSVSGLDVAGHLRATQPHMKLILFSAASHEADLLTGRVDAVVAKTDIADLGDIALRVLEDGLSPLTD